MRTNRASPCYIYYRVYVDLQNLVKIGRCTAELLPIFDFQNGGRPPSWIWYDVIADHLRLVFDGPNILLKLHVDRFYLRDILSAVIATATWLAGWLGGCLSQPVLYQND